MVVVVDSGTVVSPGMVEPGTVVEVLLPPGAVVVELLLVEVDEVGPGPPVCPWKADAGNAKRTPMATPIEMTAPSTRLGFEVTG